MNQAPPSAHSFDWGAAYAYETEISTRVLSERMSWFVKIRWAVVALFLLGAAAASCNLLPAALTAGLFLSEAAFMAGVNAVYAWIGRHLAATALDMRRARRLLSAQVLTDYAALSVLTYYSGSIETPIFVLFIPHVILVSLFFSPRTSLIMTAIAFVAATAPVGLELSGVIPTVSILHLPLKEKVLSDWRMTVIFMGALAACYAFCWYLTSEIAARLHLREHQLEESHRLLEALDREKTQATLRATHELKAPFAAIKNYVYTLRDGYYGTLPEEALTVIARIGERCDRLTRMITDIIHVSNLRTVVMSEAEFKAVHLSKFLIHEVEEASVLGRARRITVALETSNDSRTWIRASPRYLHTMVSNLLRNAVHYSYDGGRVEVAVEATGGDVVLRIADQGIGIPKDNIAKIFDDFFRTANAVKQNPSGNGLGLSMVKEIVKLHGARIDVISDEGRGTCFSVRFTPLQPDEGRSDGQNPSHR